MEEIDIASLNFDTDKLAQSALRARKEIDELSNEISKSRKESKDSQKVIDLLTEANKKLAESGKETSKSYKENEVEIAKLNSKIEENTKKVIDNESKKRNLNKEQRDINKLLDLQTKKQQENNLVIEQSNAILSQSFSTQKEAREVGSAMMSLRQQLNPLIEEEAELMKRLSERTNEANEFQALYNTENEQRVKGIGQYKDAIVDALKEQGLFNSTMGKSGGASDAFSSGITGAIGGINGLSTATKGFTAIPLIAVVTLLIKGFTFLYDKFKETQGGMDAITKVTRPLMAIFESLSGVAQNLATSFFKMATEPKKAFTDLVDFIKNNVMNRFKAFGVILEAIENRDFKGLRNGIAQAITGVEDLEDKIIDGAKRTADFMQQAYDKGVQLDNIQKEIEKRETDFELRSREINRLMKEQRLIAADTSKSSQQRAAAIAEQIRLAKELTGEETKILDLKINQEEINQSLNDTSRKDTKELNRLLGQREEVENRLSDTIKQNLGAEKQLRDEAAAIAKQERQARVNAILEEKNATLDLFVLRKKGTQENLKEELDFFKNIQDQKTEILETQLKNKLISQVAYETELEKLNIETLKSEAEARAYYATVMLNEEIKNLQETTAERKRLTDENIEYEKSKLNEVLESQKLIEQQRVEAGVISRQEYNEKILELELAKNDRIKELDKSYEEQNKADRDLARMLENEAVLMNMEDQFEREQELLRQQTEERILALDEQRAEGLISEENYLASLRVLNQKYADDQKTIDEAISDNKVSLMSGAFGDISSILGKSTTEGKFFASAQAAVDTYAAATKALSAYPPPFSYIAMASTIATGIGNIAKINSVKTQKYSGGPTSDGGGMFTRTGYTHAGEVVFSQADVRQLGGVNAVEKVRPTSPMFQGMPTGNGNINQSETNWQAIAVILGASVMEGTAKGTNSGLTQASDNIRVKEMAKF